MTRPSSAATRLGLLAAALVLSGCSQGDPATGGGGPDPATTPAGWSEDDVRPAVADGACGRVSSGVLADLGLPSGGPPPDDCRWTGRTSSGEVELVVDLTAHEPAGSASASEVAETSRPALSGDDPREVGLADGATITTTQPQPVGGDVLYSPPAPSAVQLVTRAGNVVVTTSVLATGTLTGLPDRPTPGDLETAAVTATRDVLAAVGLEVADVTGGQDGPVTEPPTRPCPASAALRRVVPGGTVTELDRPDGGATAVCEVGPAGDPPSGERLQVAVEAVDGSVDGTPATRVAADRLAGPDDAEPVEAWATRPCHGARTAARRSSRRAGPTWWSSSVTSAPTSSPATRTWSPTWRRSPGQRWAEPAVDRAYTCGMTSAATRRSWSRSPRSRTCR